MRYSDGFLLVPDGIRLHFRDYDGPRDRPPLLCLHGLTRNARDFEAFAERYSPRFRVLVLEFRGRGESEYDPVAARYTPPTYAADVQQVLDQLGVDRANFVGTSLGGLVTMALAVLAPERIAAAILNDVGPELGQAGLDRIQSYVGRGERFESWREAAAAIAENQGSAFPEYGPDDWLATARRHCRESGGKIAFDYDPAIAEPFKTAGAAPTVDLWPFFMALAQKRLLVVRGQLSELLSAQTLAKMKEAAPRARFAEIPNVGHAPTLDEPAAIEAIGEFLDSIRE